ncbi:MAG TPA: hypothetical protein VLA26_07420 [Gammaproteobacteria bacterium]|nr:hypothetical protein [Gammaproteobacteria bacterium]
MSEMQLSQEMIQAVQEIIVAQDPRARDAGITAQYLSAIIGVLLGSQKMPRADKMEILEQLSAFSQHVMDDIEGQQQPATPAPDAAFGIWRPGDN